LDRRKQFSLLLVRGDGMRVLRFNFARPLATASFLLLAVTVSVTGAVVGDYLKLRHLTREAVTYADQIAEQRKTIDAFNQRVAALSKEMAGWRELHARIQEPFGPERASAMRDKGIGGSTSKSSETRHAMVSPGDELNHLAATVTEAGENLRALDRLMARAGKALAALPSRWPVRGAVNSEYGNRLSPWSKATEFHGGLDIGAGIGTPIYAPAAGTVFFAGKQPEYGTAIIVDHGQDIRSLYGHLSKLAVQNGQKVERGMVIGYTGNTGRSSGPHLHYEILVKGQPVNPRAYLWD
jgi:murein DD-endopeptidase MepM/ murein hydrolase activator NlpD